jgi:hypothetical protein
MYIKESQVEIQTPTEWKYIGRSMTGPAVCVIDQQYSSVTFVSLHVHSRKEKFGVA